MNGERAVDEFHETYNMYLHAKIYYNNNIIRSHCRRWPILIKFELIDSFNTLFLLYFPFAPDNTIIYNCSGVVHIIIPTLVRGHGRGGNQYIIEQLVVCTCAIKSIEMMECLIIYLNLLKKSFCLWRGKRDLID